MKKVVIGVIIAICCVCIGGGVAYATAKGSSNSTLPQGVALSNQQETPAEQTLQKNNPNSFLCLQNNCSVVSVITLFHLICL